MAKVPPIVFPSSTSVTTPAPSIPHHRRILTPSFTPSSASPAPKLPFMSFDISSAASTSSASSAPVFSSSASFDDEPPLLEELGINTRQIWSKTASILNPFRLSNPSSISLHHDADLSGPFLSLIAFGFFRILAGKFYFGIILGWLTVSSLFIYVVFNMLAGRSGNLDLYRCLSLVGYCMMPMAIFSAVALFMPAGGVVVFWLGGVFVIWSTRACTRLLVELAPCGDEHKGLIAYACGLVYLLFSLLVVF